MKGRAMGCLRRLERSGGTPTAKAWSEITVSFKAQLRALKPHARILRDNR